MDIFVTWQRGVTHHSVHTILLLRLYLVGKLVLCHTLDCLLPQDLTSALALVADTVLIIKDMDVKEHERLSNFTHRHKS